MDRAIWRAAAAAHCGRVCPAGIGQRRGQEHPVRGATGRDARYRLRHLSLHVLFLAAVGLRAGGLRLPGAEGGQDGGRGEGVFHLRGPGPVRRRAVWRSGRRAARSRSGIRGGHGPAAPRGLDRSGGHALWREAAGGHGDRAHQAGCAIVPQGNPGVHRLSQGQWRSDARFPLHQRTGWLRAGVRFPARLGLRHFRHAHL